MRWQQLFGQNMLRRPSHFDKKMATKGRAGTKPKAINQKQTKQPEKQQQQIQQQQWLAPDTFQHVCQIDQSESRNFGLINIKQAAR